MTYSKKLEQFRIPINVRSCLYNQFKFSGISFDRLFWCFYLIAYDSLMPKYFASFLFNIVS